MKADRLIIALTPVVSQQLATDLVSDFTKMRHDFATKTLERATPGKFVETFVQCAQQMSTGRHDKQPNVDAYLNTTIENQASLPEGIRVCAGRLARSMYTMRNKRNVAHKGEIDPNTIDLGYCYYASSWVMSELLRTASGLSMEEAGRLIAEVQLPVDTLVEDFDETRLVLHDTGVKGELLILLHSYYPQYVGVAGILRSLSRRDAKQVRNRIGEIYADKLIHGDNAKGYVLTQRGYALGTEEIRKLLKRA